MAAVAATPGRRSLIGKTAAAVAARRAARGGRPGRLAAAVAVARQHVVTVAALSSVDAGMWHFGPAAGWIATGVLALVADFAVRG